MNTFLKKTTLLTISCLFLLFTSIMANGDKATLLNAYKTASTPSEKYSVCMQLSKIYKAENADSSLIFAREALSISEQLTDSIQSFTIEAISKVHLYHSNIDSAIYFARILIDLAKKKEDVKREIYGYNLIGRAYYQISEFEKALEAQLIALEIVQANNDDKKMEMKLLSNIGVNYDEMGNYSLALEYYFKSLKKAEEAKDSSSTAYAGLNIGTVYFQLNEVESALKANQKALSLFKQLDNEKEGESICLDNLAEYSFALGKFDSAEIYANQALYIGQEINDVIGISISYTILGKLKVNEDSIPKGIAYFNKALSISEDIDDKQGVSQILSLISEAYSLQGQLNKARMYGEKALKIAEGLSSLDERQTAHLALYKSYKKSKKSEKALYHYEKQVALKDSLFNEKNTSVMVHLKSSYELDKKLIRKLNQISLLEKEKKILETESTLASVESEKQNLLLNSLLIGGGLLILAIFSLYRNNYNKGKANKILADKNLEIESKSNKITASLNYAKRIQTAILPFHTRLSSFFAEHFVIYKPKDVVSGDFYYFQEVDGKGILVVADCTGHGIPGAFMSMIGNSLLNQIILAQEELSPHTILEKMHQGVVTALHQGGHNLKDGMEMAVCLIDRKNATLSFAGAKLPIIIIADGEYQEFKGQKRAIGEQSKRESMPFESTKVDIKPNTQIYLLTDGLQDQFGGEDNNKFMMKRIRTLLKENQHLSMSAQSEVMQNALTNWMQAGKEEQVDDILLFGAKI